MSNKTSPINRGRVIDFKSSVDKEKANQFFRVRLWDRDDLIEELLNDYEKLDASIRAELPLKHIRTITYVDESD